MLVGGITCLKALVGHNFCPTMISCILFDVVPDTITIPF